MNSRDDDCARDGDVPRYQSLQTVLERGVELAASLVTRYRHTLQIDDAQGVTLRGDLVRLAGRAPGTATANQRSPQTRDEELARRVCSVFSPL